MTLFFFNHAARSRDPRPARRADDLLRDEGARHLLQRIRALGYQVDVKCDGAAGVAIRASDARTGEHHVVQISSTESEGQAVDDLAELIASELEG